MISCFLGGALEDNEQPLSSRYNRRSQEGSIDIAGAQGLLATLRPSDGEPAKPWHAGLARTRRLAAEPKRTPP